MEYRKLTKYPGVYERLSDVRMHINKPDVCYDISYKHDGKKIWEKVGWLSEGYSPKLAAEVRGERLRSIRHGQELPQQKRKHLYFKELAEKYLKWAEENKKSAFSDKHRYKNHLAARFDDKRINEITSFDLEKMKSELLKEGLAPATVKYCLVLFRQMINKAIIWKLYEGANPVKGVKLPTVQNQRERFLSFTEADLLLNELRKHSEILYSMALLSLHCGLRIGEILNLKWRDLDFEHEIITIFDAKNMRNMGPKKSYMTIVVKEMLRDKTQGTPDSYVFMQRSGERYNEVPQLYRLITNRLFNAGIKDSRHRVVFHTLRHTFASWLALQGESLFTIRELLGHKSFAMTQRYTHLIPDEKRRAAVMLDKVFSEQRNGNIERIGEANGKI